MARLWGAQNKPRPPKGFFPKISSERPALEGFRLFYAEKKTKKYNSSVLFEKKKIGH